MPTSRHYLEVRQIQWVVLVFSAAWVRNKCYVVFIVDISLLKKNIAARNAARMLFSLAYCEAS